MYPLIFWENNSLTGVERTNSVKLLTHEGVLT